MSNYYDARTWTEFMNSGMLWFVNRILHVFGWVIVAELDSVGCVKNAWPAKTNVLGFDINYDETSRYKFLTHVRETME